MNFLNPYEDNYYTRALGGVKPYHPTYCEFGTSQPISFLTSSGLKRMEPGKCYDADLNEIPPLL